MLQYLNFKVDLRLIQWGHLKSCYTVSSAAPSNLQYLLNYTKNKITYSLESCLNLKYYDFDTLNWQGSRVCWVQIIQISIDQRKKLFQFLYLFIYNRGIFTLRRSCLRGSWCFVYWLPLLHLHICKFLLVVHKFFWKCNTCFGEGNKCLFELFDTWE